MVNEKLRNSTLVLRVPATEARLYGHSSLQSIPSQGLPKKRWFTLAINQELLALMEQVGCDLDFGEF